MQFSWQLALWLATSMLVATSAGGLLWWGLGSPDFTGGALTPKDRLELVKLSLAIAGGIGAVVALVVAYRRQRVSEAAHRISEADHQREATRLLNERYTDAVEQLGSERAAVRLGAVYALARLADDWRDGRQTCIDVLCAYLRMPYTPLPAPTESDDQQADGSSATWSDEQRLRREERQVRHTVIRIIGDHLRLDTSHAKSWQGHDFDFTEAVFDGGDFHDAQFTGGQVKFNRARFTGGHINFAGAKFTAGEVHFKYARFTGGHVNFSRVQFNGSEVHFNHVRVTGGKINFADARFTGGRVRFSAGKFAGGHVDFTHAGFTGGQVKFADAQFIDGIVEFVEAQFVDGLVNFAGAQFTGGAVDLDRAQFIDGLITFDGAQFTDGQVRFSGAQFAGGEVTFAGARFAGSQVNFTNAQFAGGLANLSTPSSYSTPPVFDTWTSDPPRGLLLPLTHRARSGDSNHHAQGAKPCEPPTIQEEPTAKP